MKIEYTPDLENKKTHIEKEWKRENEMYASEYLNPLKRKTWRRRRKLCHSSRYEVRRPFFASENENERRNWKKKRKK